MIAPELLLLGRVSTILIVGLIDLVLLYRFFSQRFARRDVVCAPSAAAD